MIVHSVTDESGPVGCVAVVPQLYHLLVLNVSIKVVFGSSWWLATPASALAGISLDFDCVHVTYTFAFRALAS
jgi:hypothetical protein